AVLEQLRMMHPQVANFYTVAIETGLRPSEQIALMWSDIDAEFRHLEVMRAKVLQQMKPPKTRAGRRRVTLSDAAAAALRHQLKLVGPSGFVFRDPNTNDPWKNDQALRKRYWQPALKRAGVAPRVPYQTRHTFASTLLSRGVPEIEVAHLLGHSSVAMVRERYGRWIDLEK
ncbi:MAG: site-specific integrase, partial [Pseudomonadota bacterium]